jgi:hypothetical protein
MGIMIPTAFLAACVGLTACSQLATSTSHQDPAVLLNSSQAVEDASLVQLLALPERFHEKRVRLIGYLHLEFEGNGFYLHKQDFDQGITKNALWIDVPHWLAESPDGYYLVEATVNSTDQGHMGAYQASLAFVTRLERWGP